MPKAPQLPEAPRIPDVCRGARANCELCQHHFHKECLKERCPGLCYAIGAACQAYCDDQWDGLRVMACWKSGGKAVSKIDQAVGGFQ